MNHTALLPVMQVAVFWSVWRWYALRLAKSTDEIWCVLALILAAAFIIGARKSNDESSTSLLLPAILTLIYALGYLFMLPLARACVAMLAIGCTISVWRFKRQAHIGVIGLLLLSLPLIPSLQFFGGYPLRVMVAKVAAPMLQMNGFAVVQEGTCLNFAGQLIWVDAPCSGVRMLWAGMLFACALVCVYDFRRWRVLLIIASSLLVIIAGNIFRAVALFYVEANIIAVPSWMHEAVGVIAFMFVGAGIAIIAQMIRKGSVCELAQSL